MQPPHRPHSANPHNALNPSIFPRESGSTSTSRPVAQRVSSVTNYSRLSREADWEDAWDSSSDKEDESRGVPIPTRATTNDVISAAPIAASWASTSYQHISHPSPPHRPGLTSAKTYTETASPAAGLPVNGAKAVANGVVGSRLSPGGAWEIVEPADVKDGEGGGGVTVKTGREAVRVDMEDVLRGSSALIHSSLVLAAMYAVRYQVAAEPAQ